VSYKSQGDVNFRRTNQPIPKTAKRITDGVIARGEVTGHSHRCQVLDAVELYEVEAGKMMLCVGENGVSIVHEEHRPVMLPQGDYEITIDREYSDEGERPVVD
jgi:hypothetical protein